MKKCAFIEGNGVRVIEKRCGEMGEFYSVLAEEYFDIYWSKNIFL